MNKSHCPKGHPYGGANLYVFGMQRFCRACRAEHSRRLRAKRRAAKVVPSPEQRFWAKVQKTDSCWIWTAAKYKAGYGHFQWGDRDWCAHRIAYTLLRGPIPEGMTLDHLCRNKSCVNPDHLDPCTRGENTLRGDTISTRNKLKTHCPKGHPYSGENLRYSPLGARMCRECRRVWNKEQYLRRKALKDVA